MRKDVRIGLAIGGVLLTVLIVYLLVPKDNPNRTENGQVAQRDGGAAPSAAGDASGAGGNDAGRQPASPEGGSNNGGAAPEARQQESSVASGTAGANDAASAAGQSPAQNDPAAGAGDTVNADWASILNTGVMSPSLMATSPSATQGNGSNPAAAVPDPFADDPAKRSGGNGGSDARTAVGTPQDQIPWGNAGTTAAGGPTASGDTSSPSTPAPSSPAPTTPAVPAPVTGEYTVKQGETFSSIALSHYGDPRYYREIVKANPSLEPSRVRAGTVIKLPALASIQANRNAPNGSAVTASATIKASEPAIDTTKEYRVQPNDSLHKISMRLYGKPDRVDAIYEANKEQIGADPHRLKLGMVLKLPAAPTVSQAR